MADALELLWFDPRVLARVRKKPAWMALIEGAEDDTSGAPGARPALAAQPVQTADRFDMAVVVTRGTPMNAVEIQAAMTGNVGEDGRFVPPLVLVTGELVFPFDETAMLESTLATALAHSTGEPTLRGAIDLAKDFLATPDRVAMPPVIESVTARLREAAARIRKVPAGHVESEVERALLEARSYQRRPFGGGTRIRALLTGPSQDAPVIVYSSMDASLLPLERRFRVRILAEAHAVVDPLDGQPFVLEARAFSRIVS